MKAIKISTTVRRDRTILVQLPTETPEGLAEVIVLVPDSGAEFTDVEKMLKSASAWRARNPQRRSKEAIDRALNDERDLWDSP
jgi:hypothetical protein